MANVIINNVVYQAVPSVSIPAQGGGTAQFYDASTTTATAANTLAGVIGCNASGLFEGTLTTVSVTQDSTSHVLTIS